MLILLCVALGMFVVGVASIAIVATLGEGL
jgi:hypothetical protein